MAQMFGSDVDLNKLELQNATIQNLAAAPASPKVGQLYFNSNDLTLYVCTKTSPLTWVDALSQGAIYTAGVGLDLSGLSFSVKYGAGSGTAAQGDDSRLSDSRTPKGGAGGDLGGSYPNPTVPGLAGKADTSHTHPQSDITNLPVDLLAKAPILNPTFSGTVTVPTAAAATSAVRLEQLQAVQEGVKAKAARARAFNQVSMSSPGGTHDGVSLQNGDTLLLTEQTDKTQNGAWEYKGASTSLVRTDNADEWDELVGARWLVTEGLTGGGTVWLSAAEKGGTFGTDYVEIVAGPSLDDLVAGFGIVKTGNTIKVDASKVALRDQTVTFDTITLNTLAAAGIVMGNSKMTGLQDGTASDDAATVGQVAAASKGSFATDVGGQAIIPVTHGLQTRDVTVDVVRKSSPYDTVICEVQRSALNVITLVFGVAPSVNEYRVLVREL